MFKDASNEPPKNELDWLHEFIKFSYFVYHCKVCAEKMSTVPAKIALDTSVNNNFQLPLDN